MGKLRAALAATALLMLVGTAAAQAPPQIPNIPSLGNPDDSATFRVVVEGVQSAGVSKFFSRRYGPCTYEVSVDAAEQWRFLRGKGTTFVFERIGRAVFLRRRGRSLNADLTFAARGTLRRHATGGYNETGGPGCRGAFPVSQEACDEDHKVGSPLALFWNGRGKLEVTNTRKNAFPQLDDSDNPAGKCGSDSTDVTDSLFGYRYPYLLKVGVGTGRSGKGRLSSKLIFGRRRTLVLRGEKTFRSESPGIKETTAVDVTLRLIRVGR
jgi:hypothetical protein